MGKAARLAEEKRRQNTRDMIVREAEMWGRPASAFEAEWLRKALTLPRLEVTRPDERQLLQAGMVVKDCHRNCAAQAANDPKHRTRSVPGWWVQGPTLVLHSVVDMSGMWLCLTPQLFPSPPTFEFIADPDLVWVDDGDGGKELRHVTGEDVPVGLRAYPEVHQQMKERLLELIAEGIDPMQAYTTVDEEIGAVLINMPLEAVAEALDRSAES